jgi:hypothetical protein
LSGRAADNQILINQRAAGMIDGLVQLEPVGDLEIKGLSRPVSASNVLALVPIAT